MSKKLAIMTALLLSIVFTGAIVLTTQNKLEEATKTVEVAQTTDFIPINSRITPEDVKMVSVYHEHAKNMVKNKDEVIGRTASVSMIKGQYIYKDNLDDALSIKKGYVGVYIPTDMSSSAMVTAGDTVDIHLISRDHKAEKSRVIYRGARVLHSIDRQGQEIEPGSPKISEKMTAPGGVEPVAVEVEIPEELQNKIVQYASNDAIYFTRSGGVEK